MAVTLSVSLMLIVQIVAGIGMAALGAWYSTSVRKLQETDKGRPRTSRPRIRQRWRDGLPRS